MTRQYDKKKVHICQYSVGVCEFKLLMQQCKENNKIEGWKDIKGYK